MIRGGLSRLTNALRLAAVRLGYLRSVVLFTLIVFAAYHVIRSAGWMRNISDEVPFAEEFVPLSITIVSTAVIVFLLFEISRVAREAKILERSDSLTEVFSREHGVSTIRAEFDRAITEKSFLAVMIMDIDGFKQINLQYGYAAGDKVLAELVERARGLLRPDDIIGRMGDEEFYVILPNTEILAAHILAERVRAAVETEPFMFGGVPVTITASFGVSELEAEDTPETLIRRADLNLVEAKRQGRNRVR